MRKHFTSQTKVCANTKHSTDTENTPFHTPGQLRLVPHATHTLVAANNIKGMTDTFEWSQIKHAPSFLHIAHWHVLFINNLATQLTTSHNRSNSSLTYSKSSLSILFFQLIEQQHSRIIFFLLEKGFRRTKAYFWVLRNHREPQNCS